MVLCDELTTPTPGLLGECEFNIGCLVTTDGDPGTAPLADQLPIRYDPDTNCLWHYVCDDIGWIQVHCIDHYEPVVLEGSPGFNGGCYTIDDSNNAGVQLIDSLTSDFHGMTLPMSWSFTNPTNQTGVLTINAKMWADRLHLTDYEKAQVLFMIGLTSIVDAYTLDPTQTVPGGSAQTPHNSVGDSYDIRNLPDQDMFAFFGDWTNVVSPTLNPNMEVAADVDHKFVLAAGETVNLSARIAVGYAAAIPPGNVENGWLGATVEFVFEGHNLLT